MFAFNINVVDTDTAYYGGIHPQSTASAQAAQNGKPLDACLERLCLFTPTVFSVDGVMVEETNA